MSTVPEFAATLLSFLPQWMQAVVWYGVVALILFITVILMMAFLTLAERRVIGSIQARIGPNRVGPGGFGQPFADVLKLLVKEIVVPSSNTCCRLNQYRIAAGSRSAPRWPITYTRSGECGR